MTKNGVILRCYKATLLVLCYSLLLFDHQLSYASGNLNNTIFIWLIITKTSGAIDSGHSRKIKMAATAVWRLTLFHMQDIACERGSLK